MASTRPAMTRFAAKLEVLAFDAAAADHAADIRAVLERSGQGIGGYDLLIAGDARSRGLIVVTGDLREFARVDGLPVRGLAGDLGLTSMRSTRRRPGPG